MKLVLIAEVGESLDRFTIDVGNERSDGKVIGIFYNHKEEYNEHLAKLNLTGNFKVIIRLIDESSNVTRQIRFPVQNGKLFDDNIEVYHMLLEAFSKYWRRFNEEQVDDGIII